MGVQLHPIQLRTVWLRHMQLRNMRLGRIQLRIVRLGRIQFCTARLGRILLHIMQFCIMRLDCMQQKGERLFLWKG